MEIPLNAMEDDEEGRVSPAPPAFTIPMRGSSSLSSILSSDHDVAREEEREQQRFLPTSFESTVAPITVPEPPPTRPRHHHAGLSSLMNSPMEDDVAMQTQRRHDPSHARHDVVAEGKEDGNSNAVEETGQQMEVDGAQAERDVADPLSPHSTSDSPVPVRQRKQSMIEINIHSVVLDDQDLERLKLDFQSALQKYLIAEAKGDAGGAPAAKRHKKSKQHHRKVKASSQSAGDESIAEIQKCIHVLNQKVGSEFASPSVLSEVVRFCLSFCGVLNEKDPVEKIIVLQKTSSSPQTVEYDATLSALVQKPLYHQLLSVIRRALFSCHEAQEASVLMTQILEWCQSASSPAHWMWVWSFLGQLNSYSVAEFLFQQMVTGQLDNGAARASTIPVFEHLVSNNPAQVVDIIRDLLEEAASEGVNEIHGKPVAWVLDQLVSVVSEYPIFLRACDDSLQFVVTKELVTSLAAKISPRTDVAKREHTTGNSWSTGAWSAKLLLLLEKRSRELTYSGFQLILLLQDMAATTTTPEANASARLADAASAFHAQALRLAGEEESHAFVKGISRFLPFICQSALRALRSVKDSEQNQQVFREWRDWLELLARFISANDVTKHLIEADLMLSEISEAAPRSPAAAAIEPSDRAFCGLLSDILTPLSVDYVHFVKEMMDSCSTSAPRGRQRRVLAILQALLQVNGHAIQESSDAADELPMELRFEGELTLDDALDQMVRVESWTQNWKRFALWKGTQGTGFWEGFLDLSCSRDPEVASRALALVSQTPFESLEDPTWQYRCLRKLTTVFFHVLRQYRAEIVHSSSGQPSAGAFETQSRLEKLKVTFFRLLALDGGVAHYPSSVYSAFASLWIDSLFSTTSPTSIPTHFPNRVNFVKGEELAVNPDDRVVIRSERTISSKCTNLQSSKVITHVPETLVYRKTLDSSWEREMDAAHTCCMYATDLLFQLLATTVATGRLATGRKGSSEHDSDQCERKLKAVVDLLLERAIPCCGIPSDDTYKETLPNRSSFDMDLRIEQWLNHFPAFLPLLRAAIATSVSINSSQCLRLVPLIKSALIVLLGHWNSVKGELGCENMDVPPYMRNRNQLALTCELVKILRLSGWIPTPLGRAAELLPLTSPADIRGILFSCWFYLSDHPPSETTAPTPASSTTASPISATSSPAVTGGSSAASHSNVPLEFYLIPLRKALHNNIGRIGAKYPLYTC